MEKLALEAIFFREFYKKPSHFLSVPGRINLIGEHTDYNGGLVLPVAIDLTLNAALKSHTDDTVIVYSDDMQERKEFKIGNIDRASVAQTVAYEKYIKSCLFYLKEKLNCQLGYSIAFKSNIPMGAGLSSSAAFILANLTAGLIANNKAINRELLPFFVQEIENDFMGLSSGIMDPLIICLAKKNHALYYDCDSRLKNYIELPKELGLIVIDTLTKRSLTHSAYNQRHAECMRAAEEVGVKNLSQLTYPKLVGLKNNFSTEVLYNRALHLVQENARVRQSLKELANGNIAAFGALITESHASLRDLFEVSSVELNHAVATVMRSKYCLGARMMGAGFAGCVMAVCNRNQLENLQHETQKAFNAQGKAPKLYAVEARSGFEFSNLR
ncbi:MAG: galactokinase [Oligoflexales bacterium]|nr:galactokinase [Oligoflexales bacterium]